MDSPPQTLIVWPVMYSPSFEQRKSMLLAMSAGCASLLRGIFFTHPSISSSLLQSLILDKSSEHFSHIEVSIVPGAIELTLMLYFANSSAADFVKFITAALLAAYGRNKGLPLRPAMEEIFTMDPPLPALIISFAAFSIIKKVP